MWGSLRLTPIKYVCVCENMHMNVVSVLTWQLIVDRLMYVYVYVCMFDHIDFVSIS